MSIRPIVALACGFLLAASIVAIDHMLKGTPAVAGPTAAGGKGGSLGKADIVVTPAERRGDLNPCEIVEAGPNPGVVITAAELTKQFGADRQETRKKYDEKWAYIKGEVISVTKPQGCAVLLTLKGAGDITVTCCFGEAYKR